MLLRYNMVTELFYVCDWTVRFSTYCWTNCSALLNMTFLYSCDDRWLSQKPFSRGWLRPFAAAVVFCCKYFSVVRVTQVKLIFFFLWKYVCCVAPEIHILCAVFWRTLSQFWVTTKNRYLLYPSFKNGSVFYNTNHVSCFTYIPSFAYGIGLN